MIVRAWSYATAKHQRREFERIMRKCRQRKVDVSGMQISRLDAEQFCLAVIGEPEEVERCASLARPNGREITLNGREAGALIVRRQRFIDSGVHGETRVDHVPGQDYLYEDGGVRGWHPTMGRT